MHLNVHRAPGLANSSIVRFALCFSLAAAVFTAALHAAEPTNAKEAAEKKSQAEAADAAADAKRKAAMSPEELAWERILEENLGSFYLPIYKHEKAQNKETAWDYVKDDPELPRVLLIGDSVSRGYTLAVRHALAGRVNLHRAPENCGPTKNGLKKLDVWLGSGHWDVIHFNFGIHDRALKPDEYARNLEQIVARLEKTGAKIIWASTTPMPPGSTKYPQAPIDKLNEIAAAVMQKHHIAMDDLGAAIQPRLAEFQNKDDVHFNAAGYDFLGQTVAKSITEALARH